MTGAPISDVGVMIGFSGFAKKDVKVTDDFGLCFEGVLDSKLQNSSEINSPTPNENIEREASIVKNSEGVQKENVSESNVSKKEDASSETVKTDNVTQKADTQNQDTDFEEKEETIEIICQTINLIFNEICQVYDVSDEDIISAMNATDMNAVELLDTDKVTDLLLKLSGLAEKEELLLNDEEFLKFKEVMAFKNEAAVNILEDIEIEIPDTVNDSFDFNVDEIIKPVSDNRLLTQQKEVIVETKLETKDVLIQNNDFNNDLTVSSKGQILNEKVVSIGQSKDASGFSNEKQGSFSENNSKEPLTPFDFNLLDQANKFINDVKGETVISTSYFDEQTVDIMNQIVDRMRTVIDSDNTRMEMELHPASLGSVQVSVNSKGGVITANFVAQNENVKGIIENQLMVLKETFAQKGVTVDAIEVSVEPKAFEQQYEEQKNNSGNNEPKNNKNARIRINLDSPEVFMGENLSESDMVNIEMMKANGSTVYYTA